jgi:hypothetical protein
MPDAADAAPKGDGAPVDILPREDALDLLAKRLNAEVGHLNPAGTVGWNEPDEGQRETIELA